MKKSLNKKKLCLTAAALTLTAGLSVGGAMAYFTTYATAAGGVELSMGSTTIVPGETVSNWTKHVVVKNTGDFDCYVRLKVFAGEKFQDGLVFSDASGKWTPGADDYYYYSDIVPVGGESGEIQVKIDYKDSEKDFNVIVVQECTTVQYDADGNPYADWDVIADSSQESYNQEEVGE